MMFAQAKSEHSQHRIVNDWWLIDRREHKASLSAMIGHTTACASHGVLSA
jgi:hypothetical protein